jgi:hypothetical protein
LTRYFGGNEIVTIPLEVEVISKDAFSDNRCISTIQLHDRISRIEARAFANCKALQSLYIPGSVENIDGSVIAGSSISEIVISKDNPHFAVRSEFIVNRAGTALIAYFGVSDSVIVPREIEVLCRRSFYNSEIVGIDFESGSQLRRIERGVFAGCWRLSWFGIPRLVEAIAGRAFSWSGIHCLHVSEGNRHFRVSGHALLNAEGTSLIRVVDKVSLDYVPYLEVPPEIATFCVGSFESCNALQNLEFAAGSQLRTIEERACADCHSLKRISIPASTEVLGRRCFRRCSGLEEVRFERGSRLREIEAEAFAGCTSLKSISVPKSVKSNAGVELSAAPAEVIVWY